MRFFLLFCVLALFSCASVREAYVYPSEMYTYKDKEIVLADTLKSGSETFIHVKYKE